MKKISEMNQDLLSKWIKESGEESPPPESYKLIIEKLESNQLKPVYQPVIPALTMRLLIWAAATLFVLGIIYLPHTGNSEIWLTLSEIKLSQFQIPTLQLKNISIIF